MKESLFVGLIRSRSETLYGTAIERSTPPQGKQDVLCHSDASLNQKAAIAQARTRPLRTTSFLRLKYVVMAAIVFVPLLACAAEANTKSESFYVANRPPLVPSAFLKLPMGSIKPKG